MSAMPLLPLRYLYSLLVSADDFLLCIASRMIDFINA